MRHWQQTMRHELFEYEGRISQLVKLVEIEVPQAIGVLEQDPAESGRISRRAGGRPAGGVRRRRDGEGDLGGRGSEATDENDDGTAETTSQHRMTNDRNRTKT